MRCSSLKRSHSSPALACAEEHDVADPQVRSRPAEQRRLHLARALHLVQREPRRQVRRRQAVRARGPGGRVAAAERRRRAVARPPDDRQGEERGRQRRERPVGVEQRRPVEPEPAATSVTALSLDVRSRLPVPPPLTKSSWATSRTASTTALRRRASSRPLPACIAWMATARIRDPGGRRRRRRSAPRTP